MGGRWSGLGWVGLVVVWTACGGTVETDPLEEARARSACQPRSCESQGLDCGTALDGCGGVLRCGTCPEGEVCGGGGVPNVCGPASCLPTTCVAQGKNCGTISNGCGGTLDCGECFAGETCGGGGVPNVCSARCVPVTCAEQGRDCDLVPDGCGGVLDCGTCAEGETCGGGGEYVPGESGRCANGADDDADGRADAADPDCR